MEIGLPFDCPLYEWAHWGAVPILSSEDPVSYKLLKLRFVGHLCPQ